MSATTSLLSSAFDHARRTLFQPFRARRYLGLAFCVWLAQLGGGGMAVSLQRGSLPGGFERWSEDADRWRHLMLFLQEWAMVVVAGIAVGTAIGVVIWASLLYLQSRGTFMVLSDLVEESGDIVRPWRAQAQEAWSVFATRFVLQGLGGLAALFVVGGVGLVAYLTWDSVLSTGEMVGLAAAATVLAAIGIGVGLVDFCVTELAAPIMLVRRSTALEALRELFAAFRRQPADFASFAILRVLISVAIELIGMSVTLLSCGLTSLPFVGTLLMLPVLVYARLFSMHFVSGLASDLAVLGPPPATKPTLPPIVPPLEPSAG